MPAGVLINPTSPIVMGVLNITNNNSDIEAVCFDMVERAVKMMADGAALLDVRYGLEEEESLQDELEVLIPVIDKVSSRVSIPISIATSNPEVMQAAVEVGATMINDVRALTKLNALSTAVALNKHICLSHMYNDPVTKKLQTANNIVASTYQYLEERVNACVAAGISLDKITIDPGLGFGKSLAQNLQLLRSLSVFKNLNCQVLVDVAGKSMLGQILNVDSEHRLYGAVAAELVAISKGADIIRSHDVRASVDAVKVYKAITDS